MSEGQIRFTKIFAGAALLAPLFRVVRRPFLRNALAAAPGILFAVYAYGVGGALHPLAMTLYAYALIRWLPASKAPLALLAVAMAHQTWGHFDRMHRLYLVYTLDWTLSTMLLTLRLVGVAWAVRDGAQSQQKQGLTKEQRDAAVTRPPSLLELLGYAFFFPGFLVGPWSSFRHYRDFIEGTGVFAAENAAPSVPRRNLLRKIASIAVVGGLVLLGQHVPESRMVEPLFAALPTWRKLVYMLASIELGSCKYYFTWLFAELACDITGISFAGKGSSAWDAAKQVDIWGFLTCTDAHGLTRYWSISPQRALKRDVYQRLKPHVKHTLANVLTFLFSAIWHGTYPGYFLFFLSGAICGMAIDLAKSRLAPFVFMDGDERNGTPVSKPRLFLYTGRSRTLCSISSS